MSVKLNKTVAFLTLGCKVNSYETDAMKELFLESGCIIVEFSEKADIYVVNTCTVTNIADRKSRQMLHKAKKQNENAIVIAVGCYVQAAADVLEEDHAIDIVIGNNNKKNIIEIVSNYFFDQSENEAILNINKEQEYEELSIDSVGEKTRAYIKIQDGCNQFCSYCIIPYARGRVRSRKVEDILLEVKRIVEKGYKEIVLTGIHLSSYGIDFKSKKVDNRDEFQSDNNLENNQEENKLEENKLKENNQEDNNLRNENKFQENNEYADYQSHDSQKTMEENQHNLLQLIVEVSKISGVERIRLGSLEPRIVTEEFAKTLAGIDKICPHFHLSLQSGSDKTLQRMNRRYNSEEYYEKCILLRKYFVNPAITTDVIVGFPGETEEEFKESKEFLEKVAFAKMHIFKYSKRKGTVAASMPDQIDEKVKNLRSNELMELDERIHQQYRNTFIGKFENVLIEEEIEKDGITYQIGHNERYLKLGIKVDKGCSEDYINQIVNVKVKNILSNDILFCEIID